MICFSDDYDILKKLLKNNHRRDCYFFASCQAIAEKQDWVNFVCSDECPHNQAMDKAV
jgi:hypothetical protein